MEITNALQDGVSIITISGSIDSNTSPHAQEQILPLVTPGSRLVVDMSTCTYISSAGLRVLLMIAKQLSAKGGKWAFAGLSEEIQDVMDMTGFSSFFTACGSVSDAIAVVKKG